ncbi:MAG: hypothetical protein ABR568_22710, partial [Pyrinomonadaceae bacterium]
MEEGLAAKITAMVTLVVSIIDALELWSEINARIGRRNRQLAIGNHNASSTQMGQWSETLK